jgi:deoxyribodipyrimidine photo-lyase
LADLGLLPRAPDWAGGLRATWTPGEDAAQKRLTAFLEDDLSIYGEARDRPAADGTSRLSPHLHWGEIAPRRVWCRVDRLETSDRNKEKFLSELAWREFSYHLLYHNPDMPERNLKPKFDGFPWQEDDGHLKAWQAGRTGIPLVDAGMRQLRATGWMHNRVRMVTASFLVKHLLQPWQAGAAWFWDNLVDADLASNSASWQWVAGCGADAAPYFRIFNPILQSKRFDPKGDYLREWLPALEALPDKEIHEPWCASDPPKDYPDPIVDLAGGRRRALTAYKTLNDED